MERKVGWGEEIFNFNHEQQEPRCLPPWLSGGRCEKNRRCPL